MQIIGRHFRLTTRTLLATTAMIGLAMPALAQTAPEYGLTVDEPDAGLLTVAAGTTITGGQSGILSRRSSLTIDNAGTIRGNGTRDDFTSVPAAGISIDEGNNIIINSGTISGAGLGITTLYYVATPGGALEPRAVDTRVTNSGSIRGERNDGVRLIGGGIITNSGTITGRGASFADGISMFFLDAQNVTGRTSVGTVANASGGIIGGDRFGVILSGGGVIENAGAIDGTVAGAVIQSQSSNSATGTGALTNSGTITGRDGFQFRGTLATASLTNSGSITGTGEYGVTSGASGPVTIDNAATGVITGAQSGILSQGAALTINNSGTIRGNGTRDDLVSVPAAGVSISVADNIVNNTGTISGAGRGISTLFYFNSATNALEPRATNTVVNNSGTIRGESNDGVLLMGGGTLSNSGQISGAGSASADGVSMFFLDGQAGAATRTGTGTITNAAAGSITGDRFGIIQSGGGVIDNAGAINGKAGGVLMQSQAINSATGASTITNSGSITGEGYGVGFAGTLASAILVNSGTVTGTVSHGVSQGAAGPLAITNQASGSIIGQKSGVFALNSRVAIDNAGTVRANLAGGGATEPFYAGVLIGRANTTVTNSGTISGAGRGIATSLVSNGAGGFTMEARDIAVTNSGTITGESDDAVALLGGGTVVNSGRIEGLVGAQTDGVQIQFANGQGMGTEPKQSGTLTNLAGGEIVGARYGAIIAGGGTVNNAGLIGGGVTGLLIVDQSRTSTVGSLTNSGNIVGGVLMDVDTGTASNSGSIISDTSVAFASVQAITLTNSGRIAGGGDIAVQFGSGNDTLVLNTGSDIDGVVDGGDGIDIARLSGGTDTRTITQIVADLAAFETLAVENGYWVAGIDGFAVADVQIATGASLEAFQTTPLGEIAVAAVAIANEGTLVLNVGASDAPLELDSLTVTGTGAVRLTGGGIVVQSDAGLLHSGGTFVEAGTLAVTGTLAGSVTTSGTGTFQIGIGGTEGDFTGDLINNGSFIFDRSDSYLFGGAFSGSGDFEKRGAGTLTFGGAYSFAGLTSVTGGTIAFTGVIDPDTEVELDGATFDVSAAPQTIGELKGDEASNVVIGDSTLTIDQDTNTEFAGGIDGDGELILTGDGTLNLTGDSSFTGTVSVAGGTLAVNGDIENGEIIVGLGGALGGNGTVGNTTVGGSLTPGNSIGRLMVNGNLTFTGASVYTVEADATGAADRVDATGIATLGGATVEVLAADGLYRGSTDYTILTAAGGINGRFGTVTSNLAFLTPGLSYSANQVTLRLSRNDTDFAGVAITPNQVAVANALQSLDSQGSLFNAVLFASAASARDGYDVLSGEALASFGSAVINDGRHIRRSLNASAPVVDGADGSFAWGDVVGSWGDANDAGLASLDTEYFGYAGGVGYAVTNGYISFGVGSSDADYRALNGSIAGNDGWFVGGEAGYRTGTFGLRAGLAYAWSDLETSRPIATLGLTGTAAADFDSTMLQLYAEASFKLIDGPVTVAPFAGVAHSSTRIDGFAETGGTGALIVGKMNRDVTFGELGLRLGGRLPSNDLIIAPDVSIAWQHAWGERRGRSTQRFGIGGNSFLVEGIAIKRDAARIDAGLEIGTDKFGFRLSYSGQLAKDWSDQAARATFRLSF